MKEESKTYLEMQPGDEIHHPVFGRLVFVLRCRAVYADFTNAEGTTITLTNPLIRYRKPKQK